MSRASEYGHFARNLDFKEVCEHQNSLETHDKVPIRKILIANIDSTTPYKLLKNTFAKFGKIVHCILKKQKEYKQAKKEEEEINQNESQNVEEDPKKSRKSYAFITYNTAEEAQRAIQAGVNKEICIKKHFLRVIPANSWNQPDNTDCGKEVCYICKLRASKVGLDQKLPAQSYYQVNDGALITRLNNDCLRCIFNFLPFYDRVRVERVSRRWKLVSEEAWHDQHKLDSNPNNWGMKSIRYRSEIAPDACSVYKIFKKCCPFLTHIDLSRFSNQLGNSILIELAYMCSLIESINLNDFQFSHTGIKALATSCLSLKSITLGYTDSERKFDNELSPLFSLNRNLQHIDIDCFIIEGYCLRHIPKNSIQEITLRNSMYVVRNGLYEIFKKFTNLRVIKIIGIPVAFRQYYEFIRSICSCSKLEVVEIPTRQTRRRGEVNNLNSHILEPIANLKNLTKINLKGNCTVGDDFLILLAKKCQNLTSIDISDCPYIRDPGLDGVTSLPNLQYLCIDSLCNITDVVFLKTMPNIKTLLCSGCINMRSFGFSMLLESANRLQILDLSNCRFIANDLVIDVIRRCKRTRWRCLKMYLRNTNAKLDGINLRFHWNYLRLFNTLRPEEGEEVLYYL